MILARLVLKLLPSDEIPSSLSFKMSNKVDRGKFSTKKWFTVKVFGVSQCLA